MNDAPTLSEDKFLEPLRIFFDGVTPPKLVPISVVMAIFEYCAHHVANLLDEGALCGLNIAVRLEGRRCQRIYSQSIVRFYTAQGSRRGASAPAPESLLPHSRSSLLAWEVARVLSCTATHVKHLPLPQEGGRISRESLLAFIVARQIPAAVPPQPSVAKAASSEIL